jgi:hypothetical protein
VSSAFARRVYLCITILISLGLCEGARSAPGQLSVKIQKRGLGVTPRTMPAVVASFC